MRPLAPSPAASAQPPALARDLEFSNRDFQRIREMIYRRAGIVLANHKRDMVYSRVGRRVRQHRLSRFEDYLARLDRSPNAPEWEAFTNTLTTNLTAFFREAHHFPLLAKHVSGQRDPVRVWSAAASTGQEAYSIAIQLMETLGEKADFLVHATDIDTAALAVARRGIYPVQQIAKLDGQRRKRFFQKGGGQHSGFARVRPELTSRVRFEPLNLISDVWAAKGPFDAVFCRNVMIYFDVETQARILKHLVSQMKRDSLLFAGHSESFTYITDHFRLRGQTVYTLN